MIYKDKIKDYTEIEFLILLKGLFDTENMAEADEEALELLTQIERLTEHPAGSDIIFYPAKGREDSPQGILQKINEWRAANGKPGFKTA